MRLSNLKSLSSMASYKGSQACQVHSAASLVRAHRALVVLCGQTHSKSNGAASLYLAVVSVKIVV